jgi:hypothetical protein
MNYDPNDLLSQISAQDEVVEDAPKKKKHRSISIDFAVLFMKLTFAFDEVKRKYNFLFSLCNKVCCCRFLQDRLFSFRLRVLKLLYLS